MTMRNKTRVATTNSSKFPRIIRSNLKQVGMRQGKAREGIAPAFAAQLGAHLGDHGIEGDTGKGNPATKMVQGPGMPSELGNKRAESCPAGVGGGRTVYRSGYQGTHGAPNPGSPMPKRNSFD